MVAKFILVLLVAVFSVAFALPAPANVKPKENMKSAETSHLLHTLPFSFNFGSYPPHYGPYDYGYRGGLGFGFGFGSPYYNSYNHYNDYLHYYPHY